MTPLGIFVLYLGTFTLILVSFGVLFISFLVFVSLPKETSPANESEPGSLEDPEAAKYRLQGALAFMLLSASVAAYVALYTLAPLF